MIKLLAPIIAVILLAVNLVSCTKPSTEIVKEAYVDYGIEAKVKDKNLENHNIYKIDSVKDSKGEGYLAHPDTLLVTNANGEEIIYSYYVKGHGRGEILIKKSLDGGKTWSDRLKTPVSFKDSQETPCVYTLDFKNGDKKYLLSSARPGWSTLIMKGEGFDVSLSNDGEKWSEFENFYGPNAKREKYKARKGKWNPIVAMASLVRLRDANGKFEDKWMGIFHDYSFRVYKTILTFKDGNMEWTKPVAIYKDYRKIEKDVKLCEAGVVRSPDKNELLMIMRPEARKSYSYISVSTDEGLTWSKPTETKRELAGHRHKMIYDRQSGDIILVFRKLDYFGLKKSKKNIYFRGWMLWKGSYEALKNNSKHGKLYKMAHTYLKDQDTEQVSANGDTGYAGLLQLSDNTIVTVSYGIFDKDNKNDTYIASKRIKFN